jgi:signal transduction histidine kinase
VVRELRGELEAMRAQVLELQRLAALGVGAGLVVHELRNLLTPVQAYLQLARLRPGDAAVVARGVAMAAEGTERAAEVIEAVMAVAVEHAERGGGVQGGDAKGRGDGGTAGRSGMDGLMGDAEQRGSAGSWGSGGVGAHELVWAAGVCVGVRWAREDQHATRADAGVSAAGDASTRERGRRSGVLRGVWNGWAELSREAASARAGADAHGDERAEARAKARTGTRADTRDDARAGTRAKARGRGRSPARVEAGAAECGRDAVNARAAGVPVVVDVRAVVSRGHLGDRVGGAPALDAASASAISAADRAARSEGVRLLLRGAGGGGRGLAQQVVMNLLLNAGRAVMERRERELARVGAGDHAQRGERDAGDETSVAAARGTGGVGEGAVGRGVIRVRVVPAAEVLEGAGVVVSDAARAAEVCAAEREVERWWAVVVEDEGVGMSAERLRAVMPSARGWRGPVAGARGAGLGLLASARLAERVGGLLAAWSREGAGSGFALVVRGEG